ncbi:hypothetical protein DSLASN_18490 [Desulfoluna limicola]|uniref:Uncharacterized protein n=2 Tax=Desulfoluna limicola TaxID=2810562 RepID=A0ABM7PGF9_9BACT|nr:hypothetical protein DSLASN_18490 [Desulfoluna limicola]
MKRLHTIFIALSCFIGFWGSLFLDLHGIVAVFLSLTFFIFFSATVAKSSMFLRVIKWFIGVAFIFETLRRLFIFEAQNYIFTYTLGLCGLILLLDPVVGLIVQESKER